VWWFGARSPAAAIDEQRYATNADAYQRVALADGSLVELDARSEVAVRFTAELREVSLLRGHAHFTVAKDPARPFAVEAGAVAVRAIGTAFSVKLGTGDIQVLVTEGTVEVASPAAAVRGGQSGDAEPRGSRIGPGTLAATALVAGERALIRQKVDAPKVEKLSADAVRDALAWRGPRLVFVDTPLAEAAARFNQHNRIQLELGDDALRTLPVGGSFRADNVEAFVRLIALDNEITAEPVAPDRIVLRKAR
jgi:transmembrane sensor